MKKIFSIIVTFAMISGLFVVPVSAGSGLEPFADGDVVMFLGDSITHYGKHVQYIEEAYAARYPQRDIKFVNAGTSGDKVSHALDRIENDMAEWNPNKIVVMFGMNDMEYGSLYSDGLEVTEDVIANRAAKLEAFKENSATLVEKIKAANSDAEIIWLTPTPFDDDCTSSNTNYPGYGAALEDIAAWVKGDFASANDIEVIDLNTPMTEINAAYQEEDSTLSVIGSDRIHPKELGSWIMTMLILEAQGFSPEAEETVIDYDALTATGPVTELTKLNGGIGYTYTPVSRPLYADSYYLTADALAKKGSVLNNETISITNLPKGVYTLSIDGNKIGSYSSSSVARGVNIAENTNNGAYTILENLRTLINEKAALELKLRNYAFCKREADKKGYTIEGYYNSVYETSSTFAQARLDDALDIYKNGNTSIKNSINEKNAEIKAAREQSVSYTVALVKTGYTGNGTLVFDEDFEQYTPGTVTTISPYTLRSNAGGTYSIEESGSNRYFHMSKAATSSAAYPGVAGTFTSQTGKFIVEYDTMRTGSAQSVVFRMLSNSNNTPAIGITLLSDGNLTAFNNPSGSSSGIVKTGLAKNEFHHIKLEVDVPNNKFKIWVNGEAAINPYDNTYSWDFRQSSTITRTELCKFDFVTGNTADGDVSGAIDNIFIYDITNVTEPLVNMDFESTAEGETPSGFNLSSSLDKTEFTAEYTDGTKLNKALRITPNSNTPYFMEYPIGDRTDTLVLDFDYKIPSSDTKHIGIYFDGNKSNAISLFASYTKIYNRTEGGGVVYNQNLKTGINSTAWQHMKVVVDIDDQSMTVWHNGEFLGITPFRYAPNIIKLTKLKLGTATGTSTGEVWFDNIVLTGTGSASPVKSTAPIETYDFDDETIGSVPAGFTAASGTGTVAYKNGDTSSDDKVLLLESSTSAENKVTFKFDEVSGGITNFEFDYEITQGTCPMTRFYLNYGSNFAISLAISSTQIYSMGDTNSLKTTVGTDEGWHHIILCTDVANNSYTVTIDDTQIDGVYKFRNEVSALDNGYFGTAKHGGSTPDALAAQIDNFVIGADLTNMGALCVIPTSPVTVNYETDMITGADFTMSVDEFLATVSCINGVITVEDEDGNAKTSGTIEADDTVVVTGTRRGTVRRYTILAPYDLDIYRMDVGGDEFYEVDYIDRSGNAKIRLKATNNTDEAITPVVMAATYSGGAMVSLDLVNEGAEISANSSHIFDLELNIPDLAEDGSLKVFLFKDLLSITPLVTAEKKIVKTNDIYMMPNIFSDRMVLQRNENANIFGTAPTGTKVTVTFDGKSAEGVASGGRFNVQLPIGDASSEGKELTVTMENGGEVKFAETYTDVVVGDVYYGSGQSNMQYSIKQTGNTITEIPENFRYFSVSVANDTNKRVVNPQGLVTEAAENWRKIDSTNYEDTGAMAFYTALSLRNIGDIDVPIGFINCARGSTRVGTWVGAELILENDELAVYRDNYNARGVDKNNVGHTDLYYNMARSVVPYTVKAVIWYQGEADTDKSNYDKMMQCLIEYYRALWDYDIPYFIMQLPGYGVSKNWDSFRLQQWNIANITDNTYIVVNNDTGETDNIHPADKDVVCERLARRMLKELYKTDVAYSGPVYKSAAVSGSGVTVSFDFVNDGIHGGLDSLAEDGSLPNFEISEDGNTWYAANAVISGDTVVLTSSEVTTPKYVRFGYVNTPVKSLATNTDGVKLPLAPFSEKIN